MIQRFNIPEDSAFGRWLMEHLSVAKFHALTLSANDEFGSLKRLTTLIKDPSCASKKELIKFAELLNTPPQDLHDRFGLGKSNVLLLVDSNTETS
jgi:hypothetical protein